jgi:hypothetical protein
MHIMFTIQKNSKYLFAFSIFSFHPEETKSQRLGTHNRSSLWNAAVLRIRDILARIRIRRSVPLTNQSGSAQNPAIFVGDLQDVN